MKKGLHKIILINSYLKELVSEVEIANNTMITGGNGAGKTSMLKLIPAFFGLKTSKISKKSENADNFVQFYLPYKNSYIIFEYVTNLGTIAQVVLSRHHTNSIEPKVQYRFVSKAFDANDYLKEESAGKFSALEPQELHTSWSNKLINFTKAVPTQSDFRKIMQNDELRTVDKDFHPFTLTGGRNNLKHIDYIVHALITGKVSIPDIKSLLAKIMHQSGGDYKLQFNPNEAERWLEYYESVSRFEKKKESYLNTLENGKELMLLEDQLEHQAQYIDAALTVLSDEIEKLNDSLALRNAESSEAEAKKNAVIKNGTELLSEVEGNIAGFNKQINGITAKQDDFIELEIEHKLALFEAIPEKEKDLISLQEDIDYYKAFSQDIDNIQNEADKRVNIKKEDIKRQQADKETTLKAIDAEHNLAMSAVEQTNMKLVAQIESQFNAEREAAKDELHIAETELASINSQISAIPQDDEILEFDRSIQSTQVKEVELLTSQTELTKTKASINIAPLEVEEAKLKSELGSLLDSREKAVKQVERLDGLKNGSKGSALNALREIDPELVDNPIIKVLGHKLLLRTDLSAQIENIDLDSGIYGLHIDVDKLEAPKEFEDIDSQIDALVAQIEVIDKRLNSIRSRMKTIEQEISASRVEIQRLDKKIEEADKGIQDAKSNRSFLIEKRTALVNEKTKALTKRKDDAEKNVRKANVSLASVDERKQESIDENNSKHLTNKSDCETRFSEKRDTQEEIYDNRIEGLNADIKAIRQDAENRVNDIDFDSDEYRKKTKAYQELEDTIAEYKGYEPIILDYQKFQVNDLSRLENLNTDRQTALQEQGRITQEIASAKLECDRKKSEIKGEIKKLSRKLDVQTSLSSGIALFKNSLEEMNIEAKVSLDLPVDFSLSDFIVDNQKAAAKTQKVSKSVNKELQAIQQELVSSGSEDIRKCWNDEVGQMTGESNRRVYRAQILAFDKIVNDIIPHFKQLVISNAVAMGHNVNEFKLQLSGISKTINELGRRLSDAVNGCSNYESITDINISLESVIHKIHGWESIVDFCEAYTDWQGGDYKENLLPNDLFRNRLKEIIDIKKFDKSDVKIEDLFNVVFGVTENGRRKTARTATDLEKMSSNGLTFLFISTLYLGMIKMQRGASLVSIPWPVDELGKLSTENTLRLIGILESNNIAIATALPEPNIDLMNSFGKMYHISKDGYLVENHVEKDELALLMETK